MQPDKVQKGRMEGRRQREETKISRCLQDFAGKEASPGQRAVQKHSEETERSRDSGRKRKPDRQMGHTDSPADENSERSAQERSRLREREICRDLRVLAVVWGGGQRGNLVKP